MFAAATLAMLLSSAPAETGPSPQTRPNAESISSYMVQLQKLHRRWRRAAQLVHEGRKDQARSVMSGAGRRELPAAWRGRDLLLAVKLRREEFNTAGAIPKALGEALWYAEAEVAELAVKAFTARQKAGVELDFARKLRFAHCLVEDRKYEPARVLLKELLATEPASDWKRTLQRRLEALDGLQGGQDPPLSFYRLWYLEVGAGWPRKRVLPILRVWRLQVPPGQLAKKAKLLASFFDRVGDFTGQRLALVRLSEMLAADTVAAASVLVRAGQIARRAEDDQEALALWTRAARRFPQTPSGKSAVLLVAGVLRRQGKYQQALTELKDFLSALAARGAQSAWAGVAQRAVGHCLFEAGEYRSALKAYNTAQEKHRLRPSLHQGLCLDHLGRSADAVRKYLDVAIVHGGNNPPVLIRLLEMYRAAGQLDHLRGMLDEMDRRFQDERRRQRRGLDHPPPDRPPSKVFRRAMELRRWEQTAKLEKLVALLKNKGTVAGPDYRRVRVSNWEAVEAARLLALHPDQTVGLLDAQLVNPGDRRKWLCYALGRCATVRAAAVLKQQAQTRENCWELGTIFYSLTLCGAAGKPALEELSKSPSGEARQVLVKRVKEGRMIGQTDQDIRFPPLKVVGPLPKKLPSAASRPVARPVSGPGLPR